MRTSREDFLFATICCLMGILALLFLQLVVTVDRWGADVGRRFYTLGDTCLDDRWLSMSNFERRIELRRMKDSVNVEIRLFEKPTQKELHYKDSIESLLFLMKKK